MYASPDPFAAQPVYTAGVPQPIIQQPLGFNDNGDLNPGDQAEFEERAEYLEDYWQYSKIALPCLFFLAVVALILVFLSIWQAAGDVKDYHDGIARHISHPTPEAVDDDGGADNLDRASRHYRAFMIGFAFVAPLVAFLAYFLRPKPAIRKGLIGLACFLLLVASVFAWIALGKAIEPASGLETGAAVIDGVLGAVTLVALVLLVANGLAKNHWRMAPRSFEEEQEDLAREKPENRVPGEMIHKNVAWVRKGLITVFLIATFVLALAATVLVLAIEAKKDTEYNTNEWGRTWELEGWNTVNTRFRYATLTILLFTLVLNFMPFRSRTAALIFGFLYFVVFALVLICFALDVKQLIDDNDLTCPNDLTGRKLDCDQSHFELTLALEVILFIAVGVYLVAEYLVRQGKITETLDPVHRP